MPQIPSEITTGMNYNGFELEMLSNSTNPLLYSTDGDGIPDGEEDPDQDGLSNLMEQELGTDPLSADTDQEHFKGRQ